GEAPTEVSEFPNRPCVAVLPLQNFSSSKSETGYFADGMTEVLIAELAKNRALRVVSRTTVMPYKDSHSPLRQIARELGADTIVEGSVLLAGGSDRKCNYFTLATYDLFAAIGASERANDFGVFG